MGENSPAIPEEVARTLQHTPASSESPSPEREIGNSLSKFFEQGITTSSWSLFAGNEPVRIVYIGTGVANLAHLVKNEQPTQRANHFPFPQTRPFLPWKPKADASSSMLLNDELLRDVSSFPTREVRDALIEAYFKLVHPGEPTS